MSIRHCTIKISGRVQGVFFRASTVDQAKSLGIKGIVRNERDGTVLIEAEGEPAAMDQFVSWCHHGPPSAVVERCDVIEGEVKNYSTFGIQRF